MPHSSRRLSVTGPENSPRASRSTLCEIFSSGRSMRKGDYGGRKRGENDCHERQQQRGAKIRPDLIAEQHRGDAHPHIPQRLGADGERQGDFINPRGAEDGAELPHHPRPNNLRKRRSRSEVMANLLGIAVNQNGDEVRVSDGDIVDDGQITHGRFHGRLQTQIRSEVRLHETAQRLEVLWILPLGHIASGQRRARMVRDLVGDVFALALNFQQGLAGKVRDVNRGGDHHHQQDQQR
jgi:hypothetical protein